MSLWVNPENAREYPIAGEQFMASHVEKFAAGAPSAIWRCEHAEDDYLVAKSVFVPGDDKKQVTRVFKKSDWTFRPVIKIGMLFNAEAQSDAKKEEYWLKSFNRVSVAEDESARLKNMVEALEAEVARLTQPPEAEAQAA